MPTQVELPNGEIITYADEKVMEFGSSQGWYKLEAFPVINGWWLILSRKCSGKEVGRINLGKIKDITIMDKFVDLMKEVT